MILVLSEPGFRGNPVLARLYPYVERDPERSTRRVEQPCSGKTACSVKSGPGALLCLERFRPIQDRIEDGRRHPQALVPFKEATQLLE
jgi:hypothetical protein